MVELGERRGGSCGLRKRELEISREMKKEMVIVHVSRDNGESLSDISANRQRSESLSKFFLQTTSHYCDVGKPTVSRMLLKVSA